MLAFALLCAVLALVYGVISVTWILDKPAGTERMQEISAAVQEGAKAYLNRQYATIGIVGIVLFLIIGFGLGAQILAVAAGGGSESSEFVFEISPITRTEEGALNGYLPETFTQVVYMRDRPVLPATAAVLAIDPAGRPAVFRIGDNAYGFLGNPGIKLGMVEDLIMEFEEVPDGAAEKLGELAARQREIEDELVPIMTGLVQCTSLMSSPRAAEKPGTELDKPVI